MDWTIGKATQFQAGRSGNPGGKTKRQAQFEAALADALVSEDPAARAAELAEITWTAARKSEPWAVQLLFNRLAPQTFTMRMETTPDVQRMQEVFLQALAVLPDAQRYQVASRLMEIDRALETGTDGDVQ